MRYRSEVVRIAQDRADVTVGYRDRGGLHEIRADRCVCALPFAPLRRVTIATPLLRAEDGRDPHAPVHGRRALLLPDAQPVLGARSARARSGGLNLVGTDTMAGRVWNTSSQQADPRLGMVHAYMFDTEALEFAAYGHRRVAAMRKLMRQLLPGTRGQIVGVAHKAWQEDPWAGGGWGWTQPGELRWMFPAMRQVEGRVHFAGEHTSLWIAWMNGALESAERVVAEILARRRRTPPDARSRRGLDLTHAHAVELAREGVPLVVIQRQLGHSHLGITSVYLQGIDNAEIIETVRARRQPMIPVSTSLRR